MVKIPEDPGVYLSALYMSICRGDIPSAKLAYRCISSCDRAAFYFRDILSKAALFHFSILPLEVERVTPHTAWGIISGMCKSPLDKRALALSIMELNGRTSNRASWEFNKWLKGNKGGHNTPQPLQKRIIQDAVRYLNREVDNDEDFLNDEFSFSYKARRYLRARYCF